MIVVESESRVLVVVGGDGVGSSATDLGFVLTFFTLPTRTTMAARAGVAVALTLLRKVDPTLKVLPVGLGGRRPGAYFSKSTLGTGGVALPEVEPDRPDLTLTIAGFARIPVCAGATITAFFP